MKLTQWQIELLKETMNLGVGKASSVISELSGQKVALSVPELHINQLDDLIGRITEDEGKRISAVFQQYSGPFEGTAFLLYSEEASLEFIRLLMGSDTPIEKFSELEEDALCEVGNIVLNGCLSALGNLLDTEIETRLPSVVTGDAREVLSLRNKFPGDIWVVFLRMGFRVESLNLNGYLSFILEADKIGVLVQKLEQHYSKDLCA